MAINKSEVSSSLWQSCDELRGGMGASQYKDYARGLMQELLTGRRHLVLACINKRYMAAAWGHAAYRTL